MRRLLQTLDSDFVVSAISYVLVYLVGMLAGYLVCGRRFLH